MRLGEMLLERKLITTEDLERALELQKERGEKLGKTLVDLGFVAMRDVLAALSDQLGMPLITIEGPPAASPSLRIGTRGMDPFRQRSRCQELPAEANRHDIPLI